MCSLRQISHWRPCRIRQSVEVASANAAKEVAQADALAQAAQRAKNLKPGMKELEHLKVPSLRAFCQPTVSTALHGPALLCVFKTGQWLGQLG